MRTAPSAQLDFEKAAWAIISYAKRETLFQKDQLRPTGVWRKEKKAHLKTLQEYKEQSFVHCTVTNAEKTTYNTILNLEKQDGMIKSYISKK